MHPALFRSGSPPGSLSSPRWSALASVPSLSCPSSCSTYIACRSSLLGLSSLVATSLLRSSLEVHLSFRLPMSSDEGSCFSLGIPFAESPIGHLRFAPPAPKLDLGNLSTFNATTSGLPCIQPVCFSVTSTVLNASNIMITSGHSPPSRRIA